MPGIESIVSVVISRASKGVTQVGFGTQLVLTPNAPLAGWGVGELFREYSSASAMATDWGTSGPEYKAVLAALSQTPKPTKIKVGKKTASVAQIDTLTPDVTTQAITVYSVSIDGVVYSFTSDSTPTAAEVVTGLTALINADANCNVTASGTNTLILTAKSAGLPFATAPGSAKLALVHTTPNNGPGDDLNAIRLVNDDWYVVHIASQLTNDVKAVAAWTEAQMKMFGTSTSDANAPTSATSDIAKYLSSKNYSRTFCMYSGDAADYPTAAWAGRVLPLQPGSETWKFKSLAAIIADSLTDTQISYLEGKHCNYFVPVGGVPMTAQGVVASGEFIDVIRGIDWLQSNIQTDVFSALVNLDKIPFTNAGIAIIESILRKRLLNAVKVGLIATVNDFTITVPDITEVSTNDKANRTLPNISFTAVLAGAVHKVTINGVVTV